MCLSISLLLFGPNLMSERAIASAKTEKAPLEKRAASNQSSDIWRMLLFAAASYLNLLDQ
jgi:hypothetical protein